MNEETGMRLQVMLVPAPADEYPYLLVLDNAGDLAGSLIEPFNRIAKAVGAVGGLVFKDEVYLS